VPASDVGNESNDATPENREEKQQKKEQLRAWLGWKIHRCYVRIVSQMRSTRWMPHSKKVGSLVHRQGQQPAYLLAERPFISSFRALSGAIFIFAFFLIIDCPI
jgi:hypothetical protein